MMPTHLKRNALLVTGAVALALAAPAQTLAQNTMSGTVQESLDLGVVQQIRDEGLQRSQMEPLARHLNDVIGPRLTNSPAMRRANAWAADKFREWGLENVEVEPWGEFGLGWEREFYAGRILTPFVQPLHAQPEAWTGSTDGTVSADVVVAEIESEADLRRLQGTLAGKMILLGDPIDMGPEFESPDRRRSLESLFNPGEERSFRSDMTPEQRRAFFQRLRARRALQATFMEMARQEGVHAILESSSRQYGVLDGGGSRAGRNPDNPPPLPHLSVNSEQFGQMYRNAMNGVPVRVELEVRNKFFDDDLTAYNALGDIPGTDKADEYVIIGAHYDSWHWGTGATDNGAGSVVMMEAMRILKALGLQPRRTIRIALWSGEEQGLFGSENYLANHPELHDRISAYLNVDNGTGRIRGIRTQGNQAAIPILEQILWPFQDLGVLVVNDDESGGTDHLSFDELGIPGFNFLQDPIEYSLRTHHTTVDTFDHLVLDDLRQAAVVVAFTAYHLAMRDEMVPRKGGERPRTQ